MRNVWFCPLGVSRLESLISGRGTKRYGLLRSGSGKGSDAGESVLSRMGCFPPYFDVVRESGVSGGVHCGVAPESTNDGGSVKRLLVLGAALVSLLVVTASSASAAVRAQADGLIPVRFGLPAAKEGKSYLFSIAGAASGGVKPYRCAPESLNEGSIALHSNCVISGTAPTFGGGTTKRIKGPFVFKLTDSENPPKTITLYPLNLTIVSKSEQYPFDGVWKIKQSGSGVITCPNTSPIAKSAAATVDYTVVDGKVFGGALAVSVTGSSATWTRTYTAAGVTFTEHLEFTVAGAVSSVHGTTTGTGSVAGCGVKYNETLRGSRTST